MLVLRNAGPSLAKKVSVKFEPALPVAERGMPRASWYIRRQFAQPIPVMAPGQTFTNVWWHKEVVPGQQEPRNRYDLPAETKVIISYEDAHKRVYDEEIALTVEPLIAAVSVVDSDSPLGLMRERTKLLKELKEAVQAISMQP